MKNTIYISFFFCAMLLLYSCGTPCPDCPDSPQDELTLVPDDAIPLAQFQDWVDNWDSLGQSYTATTLTQYFTLPLIDITEFAANMGTSGRDSVVAARFYIGLDLSGTAPEPHIMLVGVNAAGDSLTNALDDQFIYDLSKPCPTLCGVNSLPNKN